MIKRKTANAAAHDDNDDDVPHADHAHADAHVIHPEAVQKRIGAENTHTEYIHNAWLTHSRTQAAFNSCGGPTPTQRSWLIARALTLPSSMPTLL